MDFLYNLFWLPINSAEFLFNIGLWGLFGYLIYGYYIWYTKNKE